MRPGAYPTPAQVSVFVGDVWIDDAFRLEVRYQNPQIPLYGYSEAEFSEVAQGKRIVQGSLIINYRYPEYLRTAIESIGYKRMERSKAIEMINDLRTSSVEDRIAALEEARALGRGKEMKPIFVNEFAQRRGKIQPEFARDKAGQDRLATHIPSAMRMSASEEVTLKIFFDTPEAAQYHWEVEGVHLVGSAMTISNQAQGGDASASGMPLYEVYTFFARRINTVMRQDIPELVGPFSSSDDDVSIVGPFGITTPEERRKVR